MIDGHNLWIWLIVGTIPYSIQQQVMEEGERLFEVHAFFWYMMIRFVGKRRVRWTLRIPLIQKLQNALWEAIMKLREEESSRM